MSSHQRIDYIDNLRIFLTISVILNHILITYGGPGGWYYREFETAQLDIPSLIILVLLTAFHQAYIMGFFFFISGYFSSKSITSKNTSGFIIQRFLRLGIPILLFVYLISPTLRVIFKKIIYNQPVNFSSFQIIYQQLDFGYELGPMWFALLLLILSILFLPWLLNSRFSKNFQNQPSVGNVLIYAVITGILTFLVRLVFPVGYVFQPLNLQIPQVVQYIFAFFIGIVAHQGNWFDLFDNLFSRSWLYLMIGLVLLMPVVFILSGGLEGDVAPALGGFHWQSLAYSLWEQFFCVSMIISGLHYFKNYANSTTSRTQELAKSTYAAYIIHPLVLVSLTTLLSNIKLHPLIKVSLVFLPAILLSFLTASVLRRIPILNRIL